MCASDLQIVWVRPIKLCSSSSEAYSRRGGYWCSTPPPGPLRSKVFRGFTFPNGCWAPLGKKKVSPHLDKFLNTPLNLFLNHYIFYKGWIIIKIVLAALRHNRSLFNLYLYTSFGTQLHIETKLSLFIFPTHLRHFKPSLEHSHGCNEFLSQNFRQISQWLMIGHTN